MKNNSNKISTSKFKRKNFLIFCVVSAAGLFTLFRNPFKLFLNKKNPEKEKGEKILVKINSDAVKRNQKTNNG